MSNVRLVFTRRNKGSDEDDDVRITAVEGCPEMYTIVYMSPEYRNSRCFTASYSSTLQYIEDIFVSLEYDTDPFDMVQLMTAIHPSVMYHVVDMSEYDVRRILMNQIRDAMRFTITRTDE